MNISDVRTKIISGYLLVTLLLVIVVSISILRFISLRDRVSYMTEDVAREVRIANKIGSEILYMRTSVENFLSGNRQEDLTEAERRIEKAQQLLGKAAKEIKSPERLRKLIAIASATNDYINKFNRFKMCY